MAQKAPGDAQTKVLLVDDATAQAVRFDLTVATPIRPLQAVAVTLVPQTTDEWPVRSPPGTISLALRPTVARRLAQELLSAVQDLEKAGR